MIGTETLRASRVQLYDMPHAQLVEYASRLQKAVQEAQKKLRQDPLNGSVSTRYHFNEIFPDKCGNSFSIAMTDINHFKQINDTFGHEIGDQVLKYLGNVLVDCLRVSDVSFDFDELADSGLLVPANIGNIVSRPGGDEFVSILPDTDAQGTSVAFNRIGEYLQEHPCPAIKGNNFTISTGIAGFPEHSGNKSETLTKADYAMYDAKNQSHGTGKSTVVVWNDNLENKTC